MIMIPISLGPNGKVSQIDIFLYLLFPVPIFPPHLFYGLSWHQRSMCLMWSSQLVVS